MTKTSKTILWIIVAVIIIGGIWYRASRKPAEKGVVKIGVIGTFTGPVAEYGQRMKKGVELAKEDLNRKKGVNGREIVLVYEDTKGSPKDTAAVLQKIVNLDQVMGVVGPVLGSCEKVAANFSEQYKKIIISPFTNFGKISPYFFSMQTLLSAEAEKLAEFAYQDLKLKRVAVLYPNNDFGQAHSSSFKQRFESLDGEVPNMEAASLPQTDFRTELTKIKNTNPDGLFIVYSIMGNIVNQMKELEMDIQILGQYGTETPDLIEVAKENANGIIYTFRTGEDQEEFSKKYQQKYNEIPTMDAANGYDALIILTRALEECENKNFDAECMKDSILGLRDYQGASGSITFDAESYNVEKPIIIKTVKNGQFVPYEE